MPEHVCSLCGRRGKRAFIILPVSERWVCESDAACERRIRATGLTGVRTMAGYRT